MKKKNREKLLGKTKTSKAIFTYLLEQKKNPFKIFRFVSGAIFLFEVK